MHEEEVHKLKKRMEELESRIFELEKENKFQRYTIEFLVEFCRSVAYKDGKDLLSYQHLNSPSSDSNKKVRMLFEKIREFGKGSFDKDRVSG